MATREIAGETILVPVSGKLAQLQQIFVLNPVGAYIWEHLDGERDLEAVHRGLVESFEVASEEAESDLFEYVGALEEAGLIVEAPRPPR
ncbi:MAG: PqqD family protein [bacterium]|nr:PqqD family protein [bacterium]